MVRKSAVNISINSKDNKEYIIRDNNMIVIGRFVILELDKENKRCNIRLNFYKDNNKQLLKASLNMLVDAVFKEVEIEKINIFTIDTIELNPFLELGFVLEGILSNSIYVKGKYYNEICLGLNRAEYNIGEKMNYIRIQVDGYLIRELTINDADQMVEYYKRNKEHLKHFEPKRENSFYTKEVQKELLAESYKQFLNGTTVDLGIFEEDKIIGKIKLSNIVYGILDSGILGYSIDKDYEGKGIMTKSIKEAMKYYFDEMELHRVEASVLIDNERSKNVLKRCGFEVLGENKDYLFIDNKWRSHITFYKINN